jgi:hypothetical protein
LVPRYSIFSPEMDGLEVGTIAGRVAKIEHSASVGGITLDPNRRVAIRLGKEIALT